MKGFFDKEKLALLIKCGIAAVLPWALCGLYFVVTSHKLSDVSLLMSEWDDELFYYKQVSGILNGGIPSGYFGYNENHAALLSFGAWNPIIFVYWAVWGFVFGWNLYAPFFANLTIFSIALMIFVWQIKPDIKKYVLILLSVAIFPLNIRYVLSCMPEMIFWSLLLIFYAVVAGVKEEKYRCRISIMFVMSVYMTLIRPFFAVLFVLTAILWCRYGKKKKTAAAVGIVLTVASVVGFYVVRNLFCASFFRDMISVSEGSSAQGGVISAAVFFVKSGFLALVDLFYRIMKSFKVFSAVGAFFSVYILVCGLFFVRFVSEIVKKVKGTGYDFKRMIISAHMFFSMLAVFFAIVFMYDLEPGSKHLLGFIAVGILLLAVYEERAILRFVFLTLICVFFFFAKWNKAPYDYVVPCKDEYTDMRQAYWDGVFLANMELTEGEVPSYNNVIIWATSDPGIAEGNYQAPEVRGKDLFPANTDWQMLYMIPDGFGITCCYGDYVRQEFDSLKCPYLAVIEGGCIDEMCSQSPEWKEIGREGSLVVFRKVGTK